MSAGLYEDLAAGIDRLPNGFPATPSGGEIGKVLRAYPSILAWVAS